jgi:hypothetical protein
MKTKIVSGTKLNKYKRFIYSFIITINVLALIFAIVPIFLDNQHYVLIFLPLIWFFSVKGILDTRKLKIVSYDDSSVFYENGASEMQVSFENIRNIEVIGADLYSINLFRPGPEGDKIWFRTSLKYPFNFKRKDAEVNDLRGKILNYKNRQETHFKESQSQQSNSMK